MGIDCRTSRIGTSTFSARRRRAAAVPYTSVNTVERKSAMNMRSSAARRVVRHVRNVRVELDLGPARGEVHGHRLAQLHHDVEKPDDADSEQEVVQVQPSPARVPSRTGRPRRVVAGLIASCPPTLFGGTPLLWNRVAHVRSHRPAQDRAAQDESPPAARIPKHAGFRQRASRRSMTCIWPPDTALMIHQLPYVRPARAV